VLEAKEAELDKVSARCSALQELADRRIDPEEARAATRALQERIDMLRALIDVPDEVQAEGGGTFRSAADSDVAACWSLSLSISHASHALEAVHCIAQSVR
jgi:hypothetical protein